MSGREVVATSRPPLGLFALHGWPRGGASDRRLYQFEVERQVHRPLDARSHRRLADREDRDDDRAGDEIQQDDPRRHSVAFLGLAAGAAVFRPVPHFFYIFSKSLLTFQTKCL